MAAIAGERAPGKAIYWNNNELVGKYPRRIGISHNTHAIMKAMRI
jgi:hypothetical protein